MTSGDGDARPHWVDRTPRRFRRVVKLSIDGAVLAAALFLAYALRFNFQIRPETYEMLGVQLPVVVGLQLAALWLAGAFDVFWRYTSLADLPLFIKALGYWTVPMLAFRLLLDESLQALRLPLSVIVLDALLAFGGILAVRIVRRSMSERSSKRRRTRQVRSGTLRPVFLVGAGRAGVLSVREILEQGTTDLEPIGFIDDDPLKVGSVIHGVPVLGTTEDLADLVAAHRPDHVVITIADAEPADLRRIVDICESIPIKVRTIPGLYDLLQGKVSIRRMQDVDPGDLLGRSAVEADSDKLRDFLTGKCVLVTGAGGSIGSELVRQIAVFHPSRLVLVDRSEFALFEIEREITAAWPELNIRGRLADVCDERRMRGLLHYHQPNVVVHAAAHKHVSMLESQPGEAVKNNVLGTALLGELCGQCGVETFVLVSTDKAVRPTSVMGASKRVAELVSQALNQRYDTRYLAVRFGNVLGSAGSVMTIFTEQIRRGGPVTVTHPDMTRYFMSIPEAAQLVLSAAAMGEGGEVFILDMGTPVSIVALAEKMIRLAGFEPHQDIEIIYTGPRSGEKLAEELVHSPDDLAPTAHPKIFVGRIPALELEAMDGGILRLKEIVDAGESGELRRFLNQLLPEADLVVDGG